MEWQGQTDAANVLCIHYLQYPVFEMALLCSCLHCHQAGKNFPQAWDQNIHAALHWREAASTSVAFRRFVPDQEGLAIVQPVILTRGLERGYSLHCCMAH